jgi:uncharacterized membrane protein YidH (DUF202 family)
VKHTDSHSPFQALVAAGAINQETLNLILVAAEHRHQPPATLLVHEQGVSRPELLRVLADYYQCASIEYDERLPIPPELLTAMDPERQAKARWFPFLKNRDGSIVIGAIDPTDPDLPAEVSACFGEGSYEYRVTLPDDVQWCMLDLLHAPPGELIGTERTGLAYWRNTMAQWRTLMACYRTDMAQGRTALSFTRTGLAIVTLSFALIRSHQFKSYFIFYIALILFGAVLTLFSLPVYLRVRRSRLSPPGNQTLVEVTSATLLFLENYHFLDGTTLPPSQSKDTMLARLGDFLANYSTIFYPSPASRERTHLARERNVLAAQRTIAGCYRTIYARARTGLALCRTGVSFMSIGIGFITYFGLGINTLFDVMLIISGILMLVDGLRWYLPVRKEQAELPRTRSAVLAG